VRYVVAADRPAHHGPASTIAVSVALLFTTLLVAGQLKNRVGRQNLFIYDASNSGDRFEQITFLFSGYERSDRQHMDLVVKFLDGVDYENVRVYRPRQ